MANKKTQRRKAQGIRQGERLRTGAQAPKAPRPEIDIIAQLAAGGEAANILAHRRGAQTESRLFSTFNQPSIDLPDWFYGIRKGTEADDRNGIDAFAVTDVGEIPLQIKSSMCGMKKFWEKRPTSEYVVLVLKPDMPDAEVRSRTIHFVGAKRRYLRKMKYVNRRPVQ